MGPFRRRLLRLLIAGLACLLPATLAGAMPTPKPDLPDQLEEQVDAEESDEPIVGQTQPIYTQSVTEAYEVVTPHGTIRGDVVRPVVPEGVQVPVILTVTPYSVLYGALDPLRASRADDSTASYFVPRGYARAVFDVVGTYGSDGCTDFGGTGERETSAAVVDFLGVQPWSNGRVGMIGGSYDGTTAIAAAVEAPEHLVTIVPQVAIDRWYDYMFNEGVRMTLEDNVGGLADPPADSPADYEGVYGVLPPHTMLTGDPQGYAALLADHVRPCNRPENMARGYQTDPVYDGFWVERDYRLLVDDIEASVLLEGAWLDDNVKHWATTRLYQALVKRGDAHSEGSQGQDPDHAQVRMVIGQWSHSASQFPDAVDLRHAWFDHYLYGLDTGVEDLPPVDTQGSDGIRRSEAAWPPPGTQDVQLGLAELALASADATWTDNNPAMVEQVITNDACADACIRLEGAPFEDAMRIVGSPQLQLTLTTDDLSTHLTPVLYEVTAGGTRRPITRGLFNSNQRHGLEQRVALQPGVPWTATVELWDTDWTLASGSHLELVLASTNATWGLADETRATTTVDLAASSLTVPLIAFD